MLTAKAAGLLPARPDREPNVLLRASRLASGQAESHPLLLVEHQAFGFIHERKMTLKNYKTKA
jgi:hypothetical protein